MGWLYPIFRDLHFYHGLPAEVRRVNPMPSSVSVCIPAYRSRFLAATIESVLNQTRRVDELLVVDDCSPHDLERIVSRYESSQVRYIRNAANLGVPANYNRALALTRSDYVMLFGDHDVMLPTFVERCARVLDENPEASFAFSTASAIDENGEVLTDHPSGLFPPVFSGDQLVRRLVTHTSSPVNMDTLIRKSSLEPLHQPFDPTYWWYADLPLWTRLAHGAKVGYVPERLVQRRVREPEHLLHGEPWRSRLVCERIRKSYWHFAFPKANLASYVAKAVYALRRDIAGLTLALSLRARQPRTTPLRVPPEATLLFSPGARVLLSLLARCPLVFAKQARRLHRFLNLGSHKRFRSNQSPQTESLSWRKQHRPRFAAWRH